MMINLFPTTMTMDTPSRCTSIPSRRGGGNGGTGSRFYIVATTLSVLATLMVMEVVDASVNAPTYYTYSDLERQQQMHQQQQQQHAAATATVSSIQPPPIDSNDNNNNNNNMPKQSYGSKIAEGRRNRASNSRVKNPNKNRGSGTTQQTNNLVPNRSTSADGTVVVEDANIINKEEEEMEQLLRYLDNAVRLICVLYF